jgi:phenylacetic acid degradation operon negative regulatory protein
LPPAAGAPALSDLTVDLPRPQKGGNSQHLLVTMLGEFWRDTDRWLPARAILGLATDLGLSRSAATTALSRLAARGVLENGGGGRLSQYRFSAIVRTRLQEGFNRFIQFGDPSRAWDRRWTVIAFTIPETARDLRETFRARLRWLGFAPLYGALWVCPRNRLDDAEQVCRAFGLEDYMLFRMDEDGRRGKHPVAAWHLEETPEQYRQFIEDFSPVRTAVLAGTVEPADAFRIRVQIMDRWRAFPWDDPDLPHELLPEGWPLAEAREVFTDTYSGTTRPARHYLQDALAGAAPEALAGLHLASIAERLRRP